VKGSEKAFGGAGVLLKTCPLRGRWGGGDKKTRRNPESKVAARYPRAGFLTQMVKKSQGGVEAASKVGIKGGDGRGKQ